MAPGYFVVLTVGELYLSPVGLSLVTKVAPARAVSMMMGVWLATSFTGGFLAGYLGSFWSGMGKPQFFLMIAVIAALAGLRDPGLRPAAEADPQGLGPPGAAHTRDLRRIPAPFPQLCRLGNVPDRLANFVATWPMAAKVERGGGLSSS